VGLFLLLAASAIVLFSTEWRWGLIHEGEFVKQRAMQVPGLAETAIDPSIKHRLLRLAERYAPVDRRYSVTATPVDLHFVSHGNGPER
jgi:hypothetical protein